MTAINRHANLFKPIKKISVAGINHTHQVTLGPVVSANIAGSGAVSLGLQTAMLTKWTVTALLIGELSAAVGTGRTNTLLLDRSNLLKSQRVGEFFTDVCGEARMKKSMSRYVIVQFK